MKPRNLLLVGLALAGLLVAPSSTFAQGTAFTYQGRLGAGGVPANGFYDLQFAVYDALQDGNSVASALTAGSVGVTNGLFTVPLDFGGGVFTGPPRWLDVAVRTSGSGVFTPLTPRQPLTPSPYAVLAGDVTAANIARLNQSGTGVPASGVPVIVNGFVVDATVTSRGSGYATPPGVTLDNSGGGSGAMLTANIAGGQVVSFTVVSAGAGYSPSTTLTVGPPPNLAYQVFAGANYFTGANQMNNPSNTFAGSFTGNAAGLTNVPGAMPWQMVASTAVQARGNSGYLLTNAQMVTLTLPGAPNAGDIIRVSGRGAGGWRIAQNQGQQVLTEGLGLPDFTYVGSSADGIKLVALSSSSIYVSTNSAETRTPTSAPNNSWSSVASSADGTKLVAAAIDYIYTSANSGTTWTVTAAPNRSWTSVAASTDGIKLVAASSYGYIYTSTNSGATWYQTTAPMNSWRSIAASADGVKLVAAADGYIYTSTNSGATWSQTTAPYASWTSVASSANGTKLVAAPGKYGGGTIYTSADSGASWTPTTAPSRIWGSVASSGDGTRLVAVVACSLVGTNIVPAIGLTIYTSTNSGATWNAVSTATGSWRSVAISSDGSNFVAVAGGYIYSSATAAIVLAQTSTSGGPAGYLIGGQGAAAELQYISNGKFYILSYQGFISAY